MLSIGNNELKEPIQDSVICDKCGLWHDIEYGYEVLPDGSKVPSKLLSFYKCDGKSYLAGICGSRI